MVQTTLIPYKNKNLFSTHYLDERLIEADEWKEADGAETVFEEIKTIYEDKKDVIRTYTNNEAQLEMDFIRPILKLLGHNFGVQATIQQEAKRPDYAFFESDGDRGKAFKNKDSDDFYKNAIAVGDAKAWDKDLDKKLGGRDVFENQNPSYQIDFYMRVTAPKWGVLTNGRKWRLYFEESPQPIGTYYEVDLIDILEKDDLEKFKYFYLFFRRKAFIPVKKSFLDGVYDQSLKYSQEIGENLEDNVYKALLWMAKGYFNMDTNNLEKNEENVRTVHENSLIFLYRLLFLFYTESKGMLGTEIPRRYANEYSFAKWVEDILNDIDKDEVAPKGGLYNHRLFSIFKLVREGSEALGIPKEEFYIPAYNGGLFDSEKHPFLKNKKIQDGHIARVVDLLARVPSKEHGGRSRVDYSDLAIRHLGGIYEGLLEFKPKLADQNMVAVKKKKTLKWIPVSEAKKDFSEFDEDKRVREGELYLATDKGERKTTGSYYTPDYIVKYVIENTVGPVIEEKLQDAETIEEKREAILSTKVLDPAMGSGHFLVKATDFLANELVKYIEGGEEEERDIDWAKRKVARNCIYGVDVNPLATELAKVSLWLNTMAEDKPLSFLDHHLKTGNSLIGADIHELDRHPKDEGEVTETGEKTGQLALSDFFGKGVRDDIKQLLGVYREMLEVTEERPEDIKEQEELFREFEAHPFKKKFDVLADVQTGYYFGNEFSKSQYERLLEAFRAGSEEWEDITQEDWIKKASDSVPEKIEDNLSDEKRFFHWKLEFPEVFFDIKKGSGEEKLGFDAVVGNPPYVRIQNLESQLKEYLKENYNSVKGKFDLYIPFLERAITLTRDNGQTSFIMPSKFKSTQYGSKIKQFVYQKGSVNKYVDFSDYQIFPEVTTYTCIPIIKKGTHFDEFKYAKIDSNPKVNLQDPIFLTSPKKSFLSKSDRFLSVEEHKIKTNIETKGKKLENITDRIFTGIQTSIDEYYVLTDETITRKGLEKDFLEKFVMGKDVRRWGVKYKNLFVIYPEEIRGGKVRAVKPEKIKKESPKLWSYLNSNEVKDACKGRSYLMEKVESGSMDTWYEVWMRRNPKWFEREKILTPALSSKANFTVDKEGFFFTSGSAGVYSILLKENYDSDSNLYLLTGLLNSRLLDWLVKISSPIYRGSYYKYNTQYLKDLPIILESQRKGELVELSKDLHSLTENRKKEVDSFLKYVSREWDTDIEDLSLKTHLKKYWKHNFKEMLKVAKRNKSKVEGSPSSRKFQEELEKEWEASVDKLKTLMEEIQDLENQIDALVFKLYELDEEEVEVVLDSLDTEEEIKQDILEKFR